MKVSILASFILSLVAAQQAAPKGAPTEIKNKPTTIDVLAREINTLEDSYSADKILNGKNITNVPVDMKNIVVAVQLAQSIAPAYNKALSSVKGLDKDDAVSKGYAHAVSGVAKDHAKDITNAFELVRAEMNRDPHYASNLKVLFEKSDPFISGAFADNTGAVLKEMIKTDPASAQAIFNGVSTLQSDFGILKPETFAKFNKIYNPSR